MTQHDQSPDSGGWSRFLAFYAIAVGIFALVSFLRIVPGSEEFLPSLWAFLAEKKLYGNTVSIAWFGFTDWRGFTVFFGAGAPTIAALMVCGSTGGRESIRRLLSRLSPVTDHTRTSVGRRTCTWLVAFYLLGVTGYLATTAFLAPSGSIQATLNQMGGSWPSAAMWIGVGPFVDEGGLWEELGWRGFALPLLLARFRSPLRATLALGVLWWAWHFPREIPNILGSDDLWTWAYFQALFALLCISLSILITPAWFATGGSVIPAILIHGGTNVWAKALGVPLWELTGTDVRTWIVVVAAGVVLVATRGRLGSPHRDPVRPETAATAG